MYRTTTELDLVSPIRPTLDNTHGATQNKECLREGEISSDHIENPTAEQSVDVRFNLSKFKMTLVIINVTSVEFLRSVVEGMVIIELPTIAADINLERGLSLWLV